MVGPASWNYSVGQGWRRVSEGRMVATVDSFVKFYCVMLHVLDRLCGADPFWLLNDQLGGAAGFDELSLTYSIKVITKIIKI